MSKYIKIIDLIDTDCILLGEIECDDCPFYDKERTWCRLIEWINSLPTIEVSEDCISREYMLRALNGYGKDWQEDCEIAEIIRNAPSVVPTNEQSSMVGEWVIDEYGIPHCSECNCINNTVYKNYCPNCGADMKKTKNN